MGKDYFFLLLNSRYLVFVLEVSMQAQEGDLQEKSKSRCRGKFGTTLLLPTTYMYFRYIKKLQVGT